MIYTTEQLINALCAEYEFLCHDDYDPDVDPSPEEYRMMMTDMSYEELIKETCTDEYYTLDEYMNTYCSL